ncbi:MAG: polyketide biosynthesis acyl carrier protein [Arenicella sp.]|jgi:polyketide biosynthesis acyl carrier protein
MKDEKLFELIQSTIVSVAPAFSDIKIQQSDSLKQLGLNSIERMEVTMIIMEELEVDVPRIELLGPKNISELITLLSTKIEEQGSFA